MESDFPRPYRYDDRSRSKRAKVLEGWHQPMSPMRDHVGLSTDTIIFMASEQCRIQKPHAESAVSIVNVTVVSLDEEQVR